MKTDLVCNGLGLRQLAVAASVGLMCTLTAAGQGPPSLKTLAVPEPPNLVDYVKNKPSAIRLGKALFWDMQVGSDNQACATCHFQAGADSRTKNQMTPGLNAGDTTFQAALPNYTCDANVFPMHQFANPIDRNSAVTRDSNDGISSQGVFHASFQAVRCGGPWDFGQPLADFYSVNNVNVRRVEPRNTPSTINAVFYLDNFWDGRAKFHFNGCNPFGPLDTSSGIFVNNAGAMTKQILRIPFSSLASQAVGPPLSLMEMSYDGRSWPDVGHKMLQLRPLAKQLVHPGDSVLGAWSRASQVGKQLKGLRGMQTTYVQMVKESFQDKYWNSDQVVQVTGGVPGVIDRPAGELAGNEYTQMEYNFSFFFGLAVQLYEATLVSDDSPYDRFQEGNVAAMTVQQQNGMKLFFSGGLRCGNCHSGPEFSDATISQSQAQPVQLGTMTTGTAFSDAGFPNVAVRPTAEDGGRGGTSPFANPLNNNAPYPLSNTRLAILKRDNKLPPEVAAFVPTLPAGQSLPTADRDAVQGAFKVPSLRNVELTGPYFHNGNAATLMQVVEFYTRGGNFHDVNIDNLHPDVGNIGPLGSPASRADVVAFLTALTDERVRQESAPFDHPQLLLPNGLIGNQNSCASDTRRLADGFQANEDVMEWPAVGSAGRAADGLPPVATFLNLNPAQP